MSISPMGQPSLRKAKPFAQGHTASQWQSQDLYPDSLGPEPLLFTTTLSAPEKSWTETLTIHPSTPCFHEYWPGGQGQVVTPTPALFQQMAAESPYSRCHMRQGMGDFGI